MDVGQFFSILFGALVLFGVIFVLIMNASNLEDIAESNRYIENYLSDVLDVLSEKE